MQGGAQVQDIGDRAMPSRMPAVCSKIEDYHPSWRLLAPCQHLWLRLQWPVVTGSCTFALV